ncbi:MAG: hypothetical protein HQK53_16280 [Oligoflexia bacterium]|nr:hypothetical protein [Oligoflexia bacterium]
MSLIQIEEFISKTSHNPIWQAKTGHGSFITFDMGIKSISKRINGTEYTKGDIHLWIYMCDWKICLNGEILCDSKFEDATKVNKELDRFIGATLSFIKMEDVGKIKFIFSKGLSINAENETGFYEEDDDVFILYAKGKNLSYNKKNGFVVESSKDY